jgi:hypothetical protein
MRLAQVVRDSTPEISKISVFTSVNFRLSLGIFLLALIPRLAVALWLPEGAVWPDGHRYEHVAQNLLQGEGFGSLAENRASFPTLPLVIAGSFSLFGEDNYLALRLVFVVMGALASVLGFAIAKRLVGVPVAIVAGVLIAVYPYFIYLSALFEYPQGLFILLMGAFFLCALRFADEGRTRDLAAAGFLLGLGVLTVPTVLIYAPFTLVCLVTRNFVTTAKRVLIFSLMIALPVGAWVARNWIAYDRFVLVNTSAGYNFWAANNETYFLHGKEAIVPVCAKGFEDSTYCLEWRELQSQLRARGIDAEQRILEEDAAGWSKGMQFILASKVRFAQSVIQKFLEYWSPIPDAVHREKVHGGAIRDVISVLSYVPALILGIWGAILSRPLWRRFLPIYFYFFAFSAPYYLFLPTTRYRLPLDFFLLIFSAIALVDLWSRRGRRIAALPVTH